MSVAETRPLVESGSVPAFRLRDITKNYPGFSLDNIDLELPPGYIMGLVGPNGAGKSTLIKILMNLVKPDSGQVEVLGHRYENVQEELAIKRSIGYVPEESNLYEEMSGEWLGRFVAQYYHNWDDQLFTRLLDKFNIPATKQIKDLSKGNRMKLSVVTALAHRPELLLLDEPTSGIDPVSRHDMLQELLEVIMDGNHAVLFSSHIVSDIERIADVITFLVDGSIALSGEKDIITDSWRQLTFKLKDASSTGLIFKLLPGAQIRQETVTATSSNFTPELGARLSALASGDIIVQPLDLEEILIVLAGEEKSKCGA